MTRPPPFPLYPNKYDSDETLFLVYNTAESFLAKENPAWSDEIEIRPSLDREVWADNGFANISGELFYYNSVEKKVINGEKRIFKFKECVRNLGGETSKNNNIGEKIRGFVIAEHHNQIVDAVVNIENFVGINFSDDTGTLDYRIRNLENVPVIFDDFNCPEINFTFNVVEDNPSTGILVSYLIDINGTFTNFRLDFGDGNYTTNILQGTHTYAPNSALDPVLTVYNDNCSTTITPTDRTSGVEPVVAQFDPPLEIPLPPPPVIPPILLTPFEPPENKYNIPPIVFPCLDFGLPSGINFSVPSSINISPITIPSTITISPISIPSTITISPVNIPSRIDIDLQGSLNSFIQIAPIQIIGNPNIPPTITFTNVPNINPTITFQNTDPLFNIPPTITFQNTDPLFNIPPIIEFGDVPPLDINWYTAPTSSGLPNLVCTVVVQCPTSGGGSLGSGGTGGFRSTESLGFGPNIDAEIEVNNLGIPSMINIVPPNIPPIAIESSSVPTSIKIENANIPEEIKIVSPNISIPSEIRLVYDNNIPSIISIDASNVPSVIKIENNIPEFINLNVPDNFPSEIKLNASEIPEQIQVVGIPPVIELKGSIPSTIQLVMPEKPEIEMVYKGAPIDVKIQLDISKVAGDGQNLNCVAIVPCK